jgi:hypothetical protein
VEVVVVMHAKAQLVVVQVQQARTLGAPVTAVVVELVAPGILRLATKAGAVAAVVGLAQLRSKLQAMLLVGSVGVIQRASVQVEGC